MPVLRIFCGNNRYVCMPACTRACPDMYKCVHGIVRWTYMHVRFSCRDESLMAGMSSIWTASLVNAWSGMICHCRINRGLFHQSSALFLYMYPAMLNTKIALSRALLSEPPVALSTQVYLSCACAWTLEPQMQIQTIMLLSAALNTGEMIK